MDIKETIQLFETTWSSLECPYGFCQILGENASNKISKVKLKQEESLMIPLKLSQNIPYFGDYESLVPKNLHFSHEADDKIIYVRLNENYVPDGFIEISRREIYHDNQF